MLQVLCSIWDNLMLAMDQPKEFEKSIREYNFKLKETGEIDYHMGMDFS